MTKKMLIPLIILIILVSCQSNPPVQDHSTVLKTHVFDKKDFKRIEEVTVRIGAIGDVLLHQRVYEKAAKTDGTYDFDPMFNKVAPLLEEPDFLMANQESLPGGVELGLSTYPSFNSPKEIVTTLQKLGVDMIIGANNHALDRGITAIESALNFYNEIGMNYVGMYRNKEDRETNRIVKVDDMTIGVLAYTYGTNGIPIPIGHEHVIAMQDREQMIEDVEKLEGKVDLVIVHMHWGNEYERQPNDQQRELAQMLAKAGVDLIFGHHPHVLQPIEKITLEEGHETLVFYSLGNFYSGQKYEFTDIGGVATVDVTKITEGNEITIRFDSPKIEPTIVIQKKDGFYVMPMSHVEKSAITKTTYDQVVDHTLQYLHNRK